MVLVVTGRETGMTEVDGKEQAAAALQAIHSAFANRPPPALLSDSLQLSDTEYAEVMAFDGLDWRDVTFDLVQACADVVFWFAPEAFCYYLPGLMAAGLRENRCDSNAYDALIGCLDRSPEPAYWDDFFLPRWTLLSPEEIEAVSAWATWLAAVQPDGFPEHTYGRVQDTLTLLSLSAEERVSES